MTVRKQQGNRLRQSICLASVLAAVPLLPVACTSFPSDREVAATVRSLAHLSARSRFAAVVDLLDQVRGAGTATEDRVRAAALSALANEYGKHHRREILDAVDAARLDGGFANDVCSFYAHILTDPTVVARYRRDIRPLARCEGISLSPSEVARMQSADRPNARP